MSVAALVDRLEVGYRVSALPVLLAYGALVDPSTGAGGLPCVWRFMSGVECLGCGLSRATALLVRGDFIGALATNWLVVLVGLVAGHYFVGELLKYWRR